MPDFQTLLPEIQTAALAKIVPTHPCRRASFHLMRLGFACVGTVVMCLAQSPTELEVTVTADPSNLPLDDAKVEVIDNGSEWSRTHPVSLECKLVMGRCTATVRPGQWMVRVSKPGYFDAADGISEDFTEYLIVKRGLKTQVDVRLVEGGSISGAIYSEDGKPAVGAFIRARLLDPERQGLRLNRYAVSAPDGEFALNRLPPGRYGVLIVPPETLRRRALQKSEVTGEFTGYAIQMFHLGVEEAQWVTPVEITPGLRLPHRTVVLRRIKVKSIGGALINPITKLPVTDVTVGLRVANEFQTELFTPRRVRPDGSFEFPSLTPGQYSVLVYRPGSSFPWVVPVDIESGGPQDLLLEVPEWQPLDLDISTLRRLRRTSVVVSSTQGPENMKAPLELSGNLTLGPLPPGSYRLSIESTEGAMLGKDARRNFLLMANQQPHFSVPISFETAAVFGGLVKPDGEPHSRGYVMLIPYPETRNSDEDYWIVRTGSLGEYSISGVPPGDYRIIGLDKRPRLHPASSAFLDQYRNQGQQITLRARERAVMVVGVAK